jgi:DNA-binding CsgD family transcriptional regulator
MQIDGSLVSGLLGDLYEAASSSEHWLVFLEHLQRVTQASRAYMLFSDAERRCDLSLQIGLDPALAELYAREFAANDPVREGFAEAFRRTGGDWIGSRESILPDDKFFSSASYHEVLVPQGDQHLCAAGLSRLVGDSICGVTLRREAIQRPFEPEVIALLSVLAPHLKRALILHHRFTGLRDREIALERSVDGFDIAVFTVSANGLVASQSAAATAILAAEEGLCVRGGQLNATAQVENARLQELLAGATATGSGRTAPLVKQTRRCASEASREGGWTPAYGGAMEIRRRPPLRPLQVSVMPFRSSRLLLADAPAALIFVNDGARKLPSRSGMLRDLYGVTPSEVRLIEMLLADETVKGAAARLKLTEGTARFTLKSIFRKTRTNSQAGLMRLLLLLPGSHKTP